MASTKPPAPKLTGKRSSASYIQSQPEPKRITREAHVNQQLERMAQQFKQLQRERQEDSKKAAALQQQLQRERQEDSKKVAALQQQLQRERQEDSKKVAALQLQLRQQKEEFEQQLEQERQHHKETTNAIFLASSLKRRSDTDIGSEVERYKGPFDLSGVLGPPGAFVQNKNKNKKKKIKEQDVQASWNNILQAVFDNKHIKDPNGRCLTWQDFSESGMEDGSKPDIVIGYAPPEMTSGTHNLMPVTLATSVSVVELKATLSESAKRREALGQVVRRFMAMQVAQPERLFMLFFLGDSCRFYAGQLALYSRREQLEKGRTLRLSLSEPYPIAQASRLLAYALRSDNTIRKVFGYVGVAPIDIPALQWKERGATYECRYLSYATSHDTSCTDKCDVFRATVHRNGEVQQNAIVKYGPTWRLKHEAKWLAKLAQARSANKAINKKKLPPVMLLHSCVVEENEEEEEEEEEVKENDEEDEEESEEEDEEENDEESEEENDEEVKENDEESEEEVKENEDDDEYDEYEEEEGRESTTALVMTPQGLTSLYHSHLRTSAEFTGGILQWLARIGEQLAAMHSASIAHGDVKPSNMVLYRTTSGSLSASLIDFEHCVDLCSLSSQSFSGTMCYASSRIFSIVSGLGRCAETERKFKYCEEDDFESLFYSAFEILHEQQRLPWRRVVNAKDGLRARQKLLDDDTAWRSNSCHFAHIPGAWQVLSEARLRLRCRTTPMFPTPAEVQDIQATALARYPPSTTPVIVRDGSAYLLERGSPVNR